MAATHLRTRMRASLQGHTTFGQQACQRQTARSRARWPGISMGAKEVSRTMSIRTSRLPRRTVIRLPLLAALGSALAACAPAAAPTATTAPAKPAEAPKPAEPTKPAAPAAAPTNTPAAAAAAKPGPEGTPAPKPAAEATKPAAAEATKPAEAAKPAASRAPAEIRLGTWASAGLLDVMKAQIADFEGRNAGNVIKIEAAPWQQYWDKMQVQIAGGTTPDVVWMS